MVFSDLKLFPTKEKKETVVANSKMRLVIFKDRMDKRRKKLQVYLMQSEFSAKYAFKSMKHLFSKGITSTLLECKAGINLQRTWYTSNCNGN